MWISAQDILNLPVMNAVIHSVSTCWILRSHGRTADQITRSARKSVLCNASPQQIQDIGRPMVSMNTCSAQFYKFSSKLFVRRKIELALAVITQILCSDYPSLQAVGSDHGFR